MSDLDSAWRWYHATKSSLRFLAKFAEKQWHTIPDDSPIFRDDDFKEVEARTLEDDSRRSLEALDDLAVVVMFSAFEAAVRDRVLDQIRRESDSLMHPIMIHAAKSARESVEQGSFFRVIEPYKARDSNLIERVNQVRRYRNWVSHGKRGNRPDNVEPPEAYRRLRDFLQFLDNIEQENPG